MPHLPACKCVTVLAVIPVFLACFWAFWRRFHVICQSIPNIVSAPGSFSLHFLIELPLHLPSVERHRVSKAKRWSCSVQWVSSLTLKPHILLEWNADYHYSDITHSSLNPDLFHDKACIFDLHRTRLNLTLTSANWVTRKNFHFCKYYGSYLWKKGSLYTPKLAVRIKWRQD